LKKLHFQVVPQLQCEEHGIYDLFPCPWPNCANGISEREFEIENLIQNEEPDISQRHEWSSTDGEKYYTWQKKGYPAWFSCKKTFWAEIRRRRLIATKPSNTVYHYTSIDGFVGIVTSRSLWMTDYSYLNDSMEIKHGVSVVRNVAEAMLAKSENVDISSLLKSWISNLEVIDQRICISSFSADGDSLSQWRAYGVIAIGFEISNILLHVKDVLVQPVEYGEEAQTALTTLYLNHLCQAYLYDNSNKLLERIPDVYHKTSQLVELLSFFKDSSFRDERELRAVFVEDSSVIESLGLKKPKNHFRVSNGHIIPYVSSSEIYPLAGYERPLEIAEVVLGPSSDEMLERGVRELLLAHDMKDVPIRRSHVPYRT